jgi:chromate transporter
VAERHPGTPGAVLAACLKLGLSSFGGPVAHLGYFRAEFVTKRGWLDEPAFADLLALCQFLPGPASSELLIAIGLMRAGFWGAIGAWIGFTLPSALALVLFGLGIGRWGHLANAAWLHGLKIVAAAVVAQAVWGMARALAPDRTRMTLAVCAAAVALSVPATAGQVGAIVLGGAAGLALLRDGAARAAPPLAPRAGRLGAALALALFFVLLLALPLAVRASGSHALALASSFYRSGALVFGGGHVLLPLLQASVVPPGWVGNDAFLAGYGAAQAVPGPLFTFAAYLGAVMGPVPNGWLGGLLCLVAVFLPGFLLVLGTVPFWSALRGNGAMQAVLKGVNAAVVGLVLAALYRPIWTSAIHGPRDFLIALAAFLLLVFWRAPPWAVVVLGAAGAELLSVIA